MEVSTASVVSKELPTTLDNQEDLDSLLRLYYETKDEKVISLRFGQWVFNLYNIEHNNSYNESNAFSAYISLIDYFMLKEMGDE